MTDIFGFVFGNRMFHAFLCLVILFLAHSLNSVYQEHSFYESFETEIPSLTTLYSDITKYSFNTKTQSMWQKSFKLNEFDAVLQHSIPSLQYDAELFVNGKLYARTDKTLFSYPPQNHINDGHGNRIFSIDAADLGTRFTRYLLSNKLSNIITSWSIYDHADNLLGHIEPRGPHTPIIITDAITGKPAATIMLTFNSVTSIVQIEVKDVNSRLNDPRLLMILAAKLLLPEENHVTTSVDVSNCLMIIGIMIFFVLVLFVLLIVLANFIEPQINNKISSTNSSKYTTLDEVYKQAEQLRKELHASDSTH